MELDERDADHQLESVHCLVIEVERERDELVCQIDVQTGEHDQTILQRKANK